MELHEILSLVFSNIDSFRFEKGSSVAKYSVGLLVTAPFFWILNFFKSNINHSVLAYCLSSVLHGVILFYFWGRDIEGIYIGLPMPLIVIALHYLWAKYFYNTGGIITIFFAFFITVLYLLYMAFATLYCVDVYLFTQMNESEDMLLYTGVFLTMAFIWFMINLMQKPWLYYRSVA